MKIKFLAYQENLLEKAIDKKEARLYVFDNSKNLCKAREYYRRPFLEKESHFITMEELKEKLFPTGKLVLKEEKRVLLLYELMTEEEKKRLGIDYYFDLIDLAAGFFNFYKELNEYQLEAIQGLQGWQVDKYRIYQDLWQRYCRKMEELGYTDSTLAFDFQYFNDFFLQDYQGLTFVNIISFTPKEKLLLERLEAGGYDLELILQLAEEDYDRENLRIRSFTLPENPLTEINLYSTEEDLLQVLNLLLILEKEKGAEEEPLPILDADFTNTNYQRLLSPDKIQVDKDPAFTETGIYRFLENLYNLSLTADKSGGELKLEINALLRASFQKEFRAYYGLDNLALKELQQLARDNYAYLNENMTNSYGNFLINYRGVFADLKRVYGSRNLQEFIAFLEEIDLEKLDEKRYRDNISQYFDALVELNSIEEMNIVSSWQRYFPEKVPGFFRLVLNYLRYKKLKMAGINSTDLSYGKISPLLSAPHFKADRLFILNASSGIIPGEGIDTFLLTEKQRKENGLETGEMRKLKDRYSFFRHIFSSRKAFIFSLNKLEENITSSPFVEELALKYALEIKEAPLKARDYAAIIGNLFTEGEETLNKGLPEAIIEEDQLLLAENDFPREFSLAYYKYGLLKDCYYKFYLACLHRLEEEIIELSKEINPAFLGDLVHELFAEIIRKTGKNLPPAREIVRETVEELLQASALKINNYYRKYYQDILFPKVEESIISFFKTIRTRIGDDIRELRTEWVPAGVEANYIYENDLTSIYLNGRIDLYIRGRDKSYLIDFKTGTGQLKQLDFYSLLLANTDLAENEVEKSIYEVFEERFVYGREGTEGDLLAEIKERIEDFFQGGQYSLQYKASLCNRCLLIEICKVVK